MTGEPGVPKRAWGSRGHGGHGSRTPRGWDEAAAMAEPGPSCTQPEGGRGPAVRVSRRRYQGRIPSEGGGASGAHAGAPAPSSSWGCGRALPAGPRCHVQPEGSHILGFVWRHLQLPAVSLSSALIPCPRCPETSIPAGGCPEEAVYAQRPVIQTPFMFPGRRTLHVGHLLSSRRAQATNRTGAAPWPLLGHVAAENQDELSAAAQGLVPRCGT